MLIEVDQLLDLFLKHCTDCSTLLELKIILDERRLRRRARDLFNKIRRKSRAAGRKGDSRLVAQYQFEEACAKTLYNLSGEPAPFDADSPYAIVPNAFALSRILGLDDDEVLWVVLAQPEPPPGS